jgi:hypothetical protein
MIQAQFEVQFDAQLKQKFEDPGVCKIALGSDFNFDQL